MRTRQFLPPFFLIMVFTVMLSCKKEHKSLPQNLRLKRAFDSIYTKVSPINRDSAAKILKDYSADALMEKDTLNIANAHYLKALYFNSVGQSDSAFVYFNASRQKYELLKDSLQVAEKLLYMADIYWKYNDYLGTENVSTDALRFIGKINTTTDTIYSGIAYNNCGLAYLNLHDYQNARKMFKQAFNFISDPSQRKLIKNNIAWAYMETGDYNRAITILTSQLPFNANDPETNAKVLDNLGYSLFKLHKNGALDYLMKSLTIREKDSNNFALVPVYIHLSEFYQGNNSNLSTAYAIKAYNAATKINSPDDRLMALKNLRTLSKGLLLEKYSSKYITIRDSIDKVRQMSKNQFAKIRYDAKQATEENLRLKAKDVQNQLEIERKNNRNSLLFLSILMLVITGVLLYFLMKKRQRVETIKSADKVQGIMAQKVHDELANDMHHTITFVETQDLSDVEKKESLINSLDSMYLRARDISRENSSIDTSAKYPKLLAEMISEYNTDQINVLVDGLNSFQLNQLPDYKKQVIWRVLQELMVNMKKHSKASVAAVRFENKKKHLNLTYSDNGVGLRSMLIKKNGLQNVENRILAIGGTITFETEHGKGLKILMTLPI